MLVRGSYKRPEEETAVTYTSCECSWRLLTGLAIGGAARSHNCKHITISPMTGELHHCHLQAIFSLVSMHIKTKSCNANHTAKENSEKKSWHSQNWTFKCFGSEREPLHVEEGNYLHAAISTCRDKNILIILLGQLDKPCECVSQPSWTLPRDLEILHCVWRIFCQWM